MANPVEAAATSAGQLFSVHRFHVPDFQREYSWRVNDEVADYWRDVSTTIDDGTPHFLGLIIMTEEQETMTIVDGQQRILTTYLLAQALREQADALGRRLVANSLTDTFLYELDFQTERRALRVLLASDRDKQDLDAILEGGNPDSGSNLVQAWRYLRGCVQGDLANSDAPLRLGQWAQHLNSGLQFAVFEHPDRNAAFKVYEVINTRGKELTPAELLKSYLIGTAGEARRGSIVTRWKLVEASLDSTEITRFVRHAATLRHGYVIQRDLYQLLTRQYKSASAVEEFTDYLMPLLSYYQQFDDPTGDYVADENFAKAARVLDFLGLATVRPLFLALTKVQDSQEAFAKALRTIVPRVAVSSFGTGGIEARFANAAREIGKSGDWRKPLADLDELKPPARAFEDALKGGRLLSRWQMHVLRASALQNTPLPVLEGGLHLVRTRYGQGWSEFDEDAFRSYGNRIGNTVILTSERRPHGSSSSQGAVSRLAADLAAGEIVTVSDIEHWSPATVERVDSNLVELAKRVWYPETSQ
ncbi:DUF262 domain-containing protein [Pseudokineococcus basanitobsidens]|uniref:DUF262 domain-containing protein n=1 Tax=Pseudokineococcus basanitobsidens TaxID=1926649 RepID=A0ABU8RFP7_9ACTN